MKSKHRRPEPQIDAMLRMKQSGLQVSWLNFIIFIILTYGEQYGTCGTQAIGHPLKQTIDSAAIIIQDCQGGGNREKTIAHNSLAPIRLLHLRLRPSARGEGTKGQAVEPRPDLKNTNIPGIIVSMQDSLLKIVSSLCQLDHFSDNL